MLQTDQGPESYHYMLSRPSGSVLPMPPLQLQHPSIQQHHHLQQRQQESLKHESSVSPPAQALDYDNSRFPKGSRTVIPSKRAAQNRAAQKAFRQRREQYIKDLEIKAKEMEDSQEEMDKLRKENDLLRQRVASLENQVAVLTGADPSSTAELDKSAQPIIPIISSPVTKAVAGSSKATERSMSVSTSATSPPPPPPVNEKPVRHASESPSTNTSSSGVNRSHNESRPNQEEDPITEQEGSFVPVPLRAPNPAVFEKPSYHPNDHTVTLIGNDNVKRRKLDAIGQEPIAIATNVSPVKPLPVQPTPPPPPPQQQYPPEFWNTQMPDMAAAAASGMTDFDLDFDFDPFFEDEFGPTLANTNDFLPNANSGQVLDDLFAMLQTRQRPQIPMNNAELNAANERLGKLG